tara:strand:+ start:1115 stop:1864 length:750 start_codon:yes stop_codon:yes gene_type:complete
MKIYDSKKLDTLPDVFLFDTDNTLYSYDAPHKSGMLAVKSKVTSMFSISDSDFQSSFALGRENVKKRLDGTAASHSRLLYMQRMLEILGLGSQILLALDLEQTYWRTFLSKAVLFDGVKELLDDIRILGIPAVVVTDLTAQIQFRKLVYFGLENSFDYVVTSEEAGYDKPHKAPFQMAMEKANAKNGVVWMIGDNPVNDIRGARENIGAATIQKIHAGIKVGQDDCAPDASFENFAEIRMYISKLGRKP